MSVTVEISNTKNLRRLRDILGVKDDSLAVEISIEKTIRAHASASPSEQAHDLPEECWEELLSRPMIPSNVIDDALRIERE
jgi:hypothetical protein